MRDISVVFAIDDEIEAGLDQLLPLIKNYQSPISGAYLFSHYDRDELFRTIMRTGCIPYAKEQIAVMKKAFKNSGIDIIV
jgi:hypothetical protein